MKTAVITGAGSGIGAATSLVFAQNNFTLILIGRSLLKLQQQESSIRALFPQTHIVIIDADLTEKNDLEKIKNTLHDEIKNQNLQIEVVINNAGVFKRGEVLKTSLTDWEWMFQNNLFSAVELTKITLPFMIQNKKGSLVNVSSTLGLRPVAQTAAYSASKAALCSFSNTLALEVAAHNIRVNTICPGIVDTPIHNISESIKTDMTQMNAFQPLGRVGTAQEIAQSIYFLASDQSAWTTGATLSVDGGIHIL